MAERRLTGRPASPGLGEGRIVVLSSGSSAAAAARRHGSPTHEAEALRQALIVALDQLADLVARSDGEAAEILGFQVAILEDPALTEPAFAAIDVGTDAATAWTSAMATEIEGYLAADSDYMQARAADLEDVRARVLAALAGEVATGPLTLPPGCIIADVDIGPSRFLAIDWSQGGGLALAEGSPSSHVAMLARARGVPMVTSLGELPPVGVLALLDAVTGTLILDPTPATRDGFARSRASAAHAARAHAEAAGRPCTSLDGQPVHILLNVSDVAELDGLDPIICDGIGLVRTEFLFRDGAPDEETQLDGYRRILDWAKGRPVVIRTLDAGGDKPIPGLTIDGESNPFLGVRGVRLSLERPGPFRTQLRALARAAAFGPLKIMVPMVAIPAELDAAARHLDAVVAELASAGVPHGRPALGMMVEVPAAALTAIDFVTAFYSVGSNDLTQYVFAAARDIGAVAHLNHAGHPAVLDLIARTVEAAKQRGVEVSVCGDAAGDPELVPALLGAGVRVLSMAAPSIGPVKALIARLRLDADPVGAALAREASGT